MQLLKRNVSKPIPLKLKVNKWNRARAKKHQKRTRKHRNGAALSHQRKFDSEEIDSIFYDEAIDDPKNTEQQRHRVRRQPFRIKRQRIVERIQHRAQDLESFRKLCRFEENPPQYDNDKSPNPVSDRNNALNTKEQAVPCSPYDVSPLGAVP